MHTDSQAHAAGEGRGDLWRSKSPHRPPNAWLAFGLSGREKKYLRNLLEREAVEAGLPRRRPLLHERNWDGLAEYSRLDVKPSLGFVEGLNTKFRVIQRRAYGL
jgi:hypothetical protein